MLTRVNNSNWFGTDYNLNIYRGCSHGCIYCDSRSDCYRVTNFDTVTPKENALDILRDELRRKRKPGVVGSGAMSDPYNPLEKKLQLTRGSLELFQLYGFGVSIATKGTLVTRDIDVLTRIAKKSPVIIKLTITAADDALAKKIEPHAPPSSARFATVKELASAGIYTGLLLMPVLPFIADNWDNIGGIVSLARESGARFIYAAFGVTQRDGQREYFHRRLDESFPGCRERYVQNFGNSYECASPHAAELYRKFARECESAGIVFRMKDIIREYKEATECEQLSLF